MQPEVLTIEKQSRYWGMVWDLLSRYLISLNEGLKSLSDCWIKWFIDIDKAEWERKDDCINRF
jgi:hypothetical protein